MIRSIPAYRPRSVTFQAWLFQIARNIAIDHYRKMKFRDHSELEENMADKEDSLDTSVDRNLTSTHLKQALASLTEDQRDVLVMRFVANMPIAQVAHALHKSEDAIKSLQRRDASPARHPGWVGGILCLRLKNAYNNNARPGAGLSPGGSPGRIRRDGRAENTVKPGRRHAHHAHASRSWREPRCAARRSRQRPAAKAACAHAFRDHRLRAANGAGWAGPSPALAAAFGLFMCLIHLCGKRAVAVSSLWERTATINVTGQVRRLSVEEGQPAAWRTLADGSQVNGGQQIRTAAASICYPGFLRRQPDYHSARIPTWFFPGWMAGAASAPGRWN
jgi:hypothetical protein